MAACLPGSAADLPDCPAQTESQVLAEKCTLRVFVLIVSHNVKFFAET